MTPRRPVTSNWLFRGVIALVAGLSVCSVTLATDTAPEATQLAIMVRQLDAIDRLAQQAASVASPDGRYHFDYARLHTDVARIRAGIQDYLSPTRAQPRDPQALSGQYAQSEARAR